MKFAQNLTRLRKQANLSQDKLAEQLHITRQAISKWESGLSTPDLETLLALCEILDVTPDQLLLDGKAEEVSVLSEKKTGMDMTSVVVPVFMLLVFVFGAILLILNLNSGHAETQITLFAFGHMGAALVYILILIAIKIFRSIKK